MNQKRRRGSTRQQQCVVPQCRGETSLGHVQKLCTLPRHQAGPAGQGQVAERDPGLLRQILPSRGDGSRSARVLFRPLVDWLQLNPGCVQVISIEITQVT